MRPTSPRVTIVGAGLGGITLARMLQRHAVPVKIYEKEPTATSRAQGGSLDMHDASGKLALQKTGLYEAFEKVCSREADHIRIGDKYGNIVYDDPVWDEGGKKGTSKGVRGDRPEIDRGVLREIFLESLEPGTIAWGRGVKGVKVLGEPSRFGMNFSLEFTDGTEEVLEGMLVGADGTWSKVRPLVSEGFPAYSGITFIEIHVNQISRYPACANLLGPGLIFALGGGNGILGQRNFGDHAKVYLARKVEEDWHQQLAPILSRSAAEIKKHFKDLYSDWSASLLQLIDIADDAVGFAARPLYMLPIGHSWKNRHGVTLVGDAAHVMTPFAGEGANLAMIDGADLGEAIAAAWFDETESAMVRAVEQFESVMFERAKGAAQLSADNMGRAFSEEAPGPIVEYIKMQRQDAPPS